MASRCSLHLWPERMRRWNYFSVTSQFVSMKEITYRSQTFGTARILLWYAYLLLQDLVQSDP